jgi:hypothetical protein
LYGFLLVVGLLTAEQNVSEGLASQFETTKEQLAVFGFEVLDEGHVRSGELVGERGQAG